ncbi:unnamed protein product [Effrenium voratum]|nr:unnamed protein product [Effrenium voratum]
MNNSTEALVQLWHMCVKSQGSCPGEVLQWETLQKVMGGLPACEALPGVEEVLQQHFGQSLQYVNFTLFWRGMEAILQSAGVFNNAGLDADVLLIIASLRSFRDAVLQELPGSFGGLSQGGAAKCSVRELRVFYERLRKGAASPVVADYWAQKLDYLPTDPLTPVTADQIAFALLKWLEELLGCGSEEESFLDDEPEQEHPPEVARATLRSLTLPPAPEVPADASAWAWLQPERAEPPEVCSFRERLRRELPAGVDEHALLHFYRAARDALDVDLPGSPCSRVRQRMSQASLRSGVALLERAVLAQVRPAFRQLQRTGSTGRDQNADASEVIIANLVCSQALAAQVLDRRANLAPRAFYTAWLLERARRRWLVNILTSWRSKSPLPKKEQKEQKESPAGQSTRWPETVALEVPTPSPSRRWRARSKTPPGFG